MVEKECNLRAGVFKVQTFGTTQSLTMTHRSKYIENINALRSLRPHGSGLYSMRAKLMWRCKQISFDIQPEGKKC